MVRTSLLMAMEIRELRQPTKHRYSRSQRIGVPYLPDTRIRPIHPDTRVPRVFQFSRFKKKEKKPIRSWDGGDTGGRAEAKKSPPVASNEENSYLPLLCLCHTISALLCFLILLASVVDVLLCLLVVVAHLCRLMA